MSQRRYHVRTGLHAFEVLLSKDGDPTVDGAAVDAELTRIDTRFHLLKIDGRVHEVALIRPPDEEGRATLLLDGRAVEVEVEDERMELLRKYQTEKTTRVNAAIIRSPMPGRISRLLVTEGELIDAGQGVLILEAMKMENEIRSNVAGIVKGVKIKEGDAVEKNAILVEIA